MTIFDRVLFLSAHTDDAELGAGATMARFQRKGSKVFVAAFSTAKESLPKDWSEDTLGFEFANSMRALEIESQNTFVYDYPVRRFSIRRQDLLEDLVQLRKTLDPEIVFFPCASDIHQDHGVLNAEALRAFKLSSLWCYELPWNQISFRSTGFIRVSEDDMKKKLDSIGCYKSQIILEKPYFERDVIEGLARVRGVQINSRYAEAFDVLKIRL